MSTMDRRQDMSMSTTWTGWVGFAAIMMAFIVALTFFKGLIAIIRDNYYVVTRQQVFLFDVSTWGWIMLLWGVLLFLAFLGTVSGEQRYTDLAQAGVGMLLRQVERGRSSVKRSGRSADGEE